MSTPPSGSAEGGSAAWPEVDGPAEPEDGAAEAAASELDGSGEDRWRAVACSRGGGDVAVLQHVARDDRLLGGLQARVLPVVVHLDDLPQVHRTRSLRLQREFASA